MPERADVAKTGPPDEDPMPNRNHHAKNEYRCSIERNQSGKYCVRIQVRFPRHAWTLGTFFLASTFDRAMKKLGQVLEFLQHNEEKLWFWGVDRAGDPEFSGELLREAGLKLDRRGECPRRFATVSLSPERNVPAFLLGPLRRDLADSMEGARSVAVAD